MMKTSQERLASDDADGFNRSMERGIFVERAMNSQPMAPRFKRKNISATMVVDVKRFCRQIKTDEVFGTHS
jgi:hypothetical protein